MTNTRQWGLGAASIFAVWVAVPSTGCGGSNSTSTPSGDDASVADSGDGGSGSGSGGGDAGGDAYTRMCGNGMLDPGEQCDNGAANGPGTGCEKNCMFTCTSTVLTNCNNSPCMKPPTCTATHTCMDGAAIPTGGSCGTGMVCNAMGKCI